ncbi:MAG: hypothetical protein LBH00_04980, partial [Planctomycetaceae bacterium]|nr:hypothetical protein [Planctomycetaceae bacterium]
MFRSAAVFLFIAALTFVFIAAAGISFLPAEIPPVVPPKEELQRPFGAADLKLFKAPPKIYYPETFCHFIGGNIARQGITADMEALAEAGIAGIRLFHGQFGGAWPGVRPQVKMLTKEWEDLVKHIAEECQRLGLRFSMQNCPGWAMSGGPWIEPANAMRHLYWQRTDLAAADAGPVSVRLPNPPADTNSDYRDICVLAFPTPLEDDDKPLLPDSVKSNLEKFPWNTCFAGNTAGKPLPFLTSDDKDKPVWVEVAFSQAVTLRTLELPSINSMRHANCAVPEIHIKAEALLPNQKTRTLIDLDLPSSNWQDDRTLSLACDETTAQTFRITFTKRRSGEMNLNSLRLWSAARKNNWEAEAGWTLRRIVRDGEHPKQSPAAFIDIDKVLDLSEKMNETGELVWEKPAGKWTVLRIGHVNAKQKNKPAPPEGTGWECNKLSQSGPDAHFAAYIGRLSGKDGPLKDGLLNGMLLDSWECRTQTWTDGLEKTFAAKTGYPLRKYLPAVFGYVVKDHETSKRFLRDWRGTIGDLFANQFYGRMAELAKENGLDIMFETAAGDIFPADILEYYKYADVPMTEFWQPMTYDFVGSLNYKPIKPTASAARMYGKPRVSAEAFTSGALTWDEHWSMLKEVFNVNAVEGVSHCVLHTYTHNPRTDFLPPGTSFGANIGTPFLRGQTWWKQMPEFTGYLARCCFMLERGKPVSDVLWYLGDEIDHKPDQNAPFPAGYKYDYCNSDVLLHRLTVQNGMLTTPEGIQYRVLWMPDTRRMLPETLEKILELVRSGATVIGDAPEGLATLSGGEQAQKRFDAAVMKLWGNPKRARLNANKHLHSRNIGKGTVIDNVPIDRALKRMLLIEPDIIARTDDDAFREHKHNNFIHLVKSVRSRETYEEPLWVHRQVDGADWYFLCAPKGKGYHGIVNFRSTGKVCEIWNPATGLAEAVPCLGLSGKAGRSQIEIDLPECGSCFVVFPNGQNGFTADATVQRYEPQSETPLTGEWQLEFPTGWGAPATLRIGELKAWKDLDISVEGKAFSGTVCYRTTFPVERIEPQCRYRLDLGDVSMIAGVTVNGKKAGTCWAVPYSVDITDFIRSGENRLEVEVTGTWFNRLVYDAGLPESER